jgi:ferritin-like metal-binding protein YciE
MLQSRYLIVRSKESSMKVKTLRDLFVHELKDLYSAEKQLTEALPKMAKAATAPDLTQAIESHLTETEKQFERVHQLLQELGENPGSTTCDAMKGLIEEGEHVVRDVAAGPVRDAALIAAAQRVEHYEISGYGTAREFARTLGEDAAAKVLDQILEEESAANEKLNKLAVGRVNSAAADAG